MVYFLNLHVIPMANVTLQPLNVARRVYLVFRTTQNIFIINVTKDLLGKQYKKEPDFEILNFVTLYSTSKIIFMLTLWRGRGEI